MTEYVTIEYKEPTEIEIKIYQVSVDGIDISFSAEIDSDGDIIIDLDEIEFEQAAISYLRNRNTDDELKDMFGIEEV